MSIICNKCGRPIETRPYGGCMCGGDETAHLKATVAELTSENARLLAANRDLQLHWDTLKADYDRLSAQIAAADAVYTKLKHLLKISGKKWRGYFRESVELNLQTYNNAKNG